MQDEERTPGEGPEAGQVGLHRIVRGRLGALLAPTHPTPLHALAAAIGMLHIAVAPTLLVWAFVAGDVELAEAALVAALIALLMTAFASER
jgi:hypothetical protein